MGNRSRSLSPILKSTIFLVISLIRKPMQTKRVFDPSSSSNVPTRCPGSGGRVQRGGRRDVCPVCQQASR